MLLLFLVNHCQLPILSLPWQILKFLLVQRLLSIPPIQEEFKGILNDLDSNDDPFGAIKMAEKHKVPFNIMEDNLMEDFEDFSLNFNPDTPMKTMEVQKRRKRDSDSLSPPTSPAVW